MCPPKHPLRRVAVIRGCLVLVLGACDFGYQIGPFELPSADAAPRPDAPLAKDGASACPVREVTMRMRNLAFEMPRLEVSIGTRVTWVNEDAMVHDVTEGDPSNPKPKFASGTMKTGERWSYDFCAVGRFVYHCAAHPNLMRDATVTVAP